MEIIKGKDLRAIDLRMAGDEQQAINAEALQYERMSDCVPVMIPRSHLYALLNAMTDGARLNVGAGYKYTASAILALAKHVRGQVHKYDKLEK